MKLPPLRNWRGWHQHYGYTHADPFSRPLPMPGTGVFDDTDIHLCFNSAWSPHLLGAIGRLTYPELYLDDASHDGLWAVNEVEKIMAVVAKAPMPIEVDCGCEDDQNTTGTCYRFYTWHDAFEFYPNNPFVSIDVETPNIASANRWMRWGEVPKDDPQIFHWVEDIVNVMTGYRADDCMLVPDITILKNWFEGIWQQLTNFPFPTVTIKTEGRGQLEIELLNVPGGGTAVIVADLLLDPQKLIDWVFGGFQGTPPVGDAIVLELNRDFLAFPPEVAPSQTQEIEFTESGEHTVTIYFIPTVNDELPFIFASGGIREIEVCGEMKVLGISSGEAIDFDKVRKGFFMTTKEELCEAVECGLVRIANRIVSAGAVGGQRNIKDGISIGKDGQIIIDKIAGRLPDPPDGTAPEAVLYGQATALGEKFRDYVGEVILFHENNKTIHDLQWIVDQITRRVPLTNLVIEATFNAANQTDPRSSEAWQAYDYFISQSMANVQPVVNPSAIAELVYCGNGTLRQAIQQYTLRVEDSGGTDAFEIAEGYRKLLSVLSDEQLEQWYQAGAAQPREGYTGTPCYRQPPILMTYTAAAAEAGTLLVNPNAIDLTAPRLFRWQFDGYITLNDGRKWNGAWLVDANGTATQTRSGGSPIFYRGNELLAVPNIVFDPNRTAFDHTAGSSITFFNKWDISDPIPPSLLVGATGEIKIKLIDLGAV